MKPSIVIIALIGIGLALYLVFRVGFDSVLQAALAIGWDGFALVCIANLAIIALLGFSWHVLVPTSPLAQTPTFIWGRLIRDAAGEVLPFSQVGGFVVGARAVSLHRVTAPMAFASTVVDATTEMMAQIAYILIGLGLLLTNGPLTTKTASLTGAILIGLLVAAAAAASFFYAQKRGFNIAEKLAERFLPKAVAHAASLHNAMEAIHESPGRVALSTILHFGGWLANAAWAWLAFHLIGTPISLGAAIAIESLVCAIRSSAFFVPNALGVQEGAYALLAPVFGVGPEVGVALSLLKRARDVTIGVPALLAWQAFEGHRAITANRSEKLLDE